MAAFSRLRFEVYSKDLERALLNLSQEQMIFDLRKISKDDLVKELDKGNAMAGTTERAEKWTGDQVLEVNWADKAKTDAPMGSITGIKPGDVKAILQKVKDQQAASLAKVADLATKSDKVSKHLDSVTAAADKELDTALAELGQFSNLNLEG